MSLEMAEQIMTDQDFQLTNYIQFEPNLVGEQNMELGRDSSLVPCKQMCPSDGVTLTQFAPDKYVPGYRSESGEDIAMS